MRIFNIHGSGVLTALFGCCMAGTMWNCCCLSASSVYTIQSFTSLQRHFIQSHIGRVCVFSCILPPAFLAEWPGSFTAVTRGWNGYWSKSQHRKLTLEKKILPLLPGLEPGTLRSWIRCSNHWAILAPHQTGQHYYNSYCSDCTELFFKLV